MTQWQKSSYSNGSDGGSCVEIAHGGRACLVRESDAPRRVLAAAPAALAALLRHLREGAARATR
ncbi:DUF397 domain-containing protein [Streptomyces sp. NBC_00237]|uniref:DUF397 domain-containing protein n=1 Tax=Streptomyces sp. NBC_00237 TaxID=2975687 RepID=UPI00224C9C58|nr:DUF397 domain-containing protein [Streptomyces sp. NBC_00237]MCX5204686.1 DUF397 domain-containing protein [Streptomyces sp. NBC_00237]